MGNGCCDRSLVIYTAALTEEWTAGLPRRPQVLPCSTQQQSQIWGVGSALVAGDEKDVDRGRSKLHLTMSRRHKRALMFSIECNPNIYMKN